MIMISIFSVAQKVSKYNLKHVTVEFLNGKRISGELLYASADSLIMLDKNKMMVGCKVTLQYQDAANVYGKVLEVTDSTVIINQSGGPDRRVLPLRQIKAILVNSYPLTSDVKTFHQVVMKASSIESIYMNKMGSGGIGMIIGGAAGAVIGYSIGSSSSPSVRLSKVSGGYSGGFFGFLLGHPSVRQWGLPTKA